LRSERERLFDLLEAIARIEKHTAKGRAVFDTDELVQTWVIHHLEIIGEAARALGPAFHDRHPEIEWAAIIGMRNILVHHYFGIDTAAVWAAIERDLPKLRDELGRILAAPPASE
jgi:uncharacterized protein with HEPN domain